MGLDNVRHPSRAQGRFSAVPDIKIERSRFNLSRRYKTTFDSGYLVPFFRQEVLPGDTHNVRCSLFARLATPLKPFMDNLDLSTFFLFVPNRLLWANWEKFQGSQVNPGDSVSFTIPQVVVSNSGGAPVGTIWDYFGLPGGAQITGPLTVSALYSRAYNRCWNDWFRDENLQNSLTVDTGDGPDTVGNYVLKRRGKRKDYFTGSLPWPQKGTAVSIPVGATTAPVTRVSNAGNWLGYQVASNTGIGVATAKFDASNRLLGDAVQISLDPNGGLIADLSAALATTINALRLAEQTQVLLERDARGGTRYVEALRSRFGVVSPDFRLQRSEYLGGGKSPVNLHPVPMTNKGDGTNTGSQGNLAAFGTASAQGHGFSKSFTEHGVILGFVHVGADLSYQQGCDRDWFRSTRYDFYEPAFAHIGEQAVLNREIYLQGSNVAADTNVWGYVGRFDEYRFGKSLITGKFRSTESAPLDSWHLAQKFTSAPSLGDTFIQDTPPVDRVIAVTSEPQFLLDVAINHTAARPMPTYGIPMLGGRF